MYGPLQIIPQWKCQAEKLVRTLKQSLRKTKGEIGMEELIGRFLTKYIHGRVVYENKVNSEIWIRHRNQLNHRQVENHQTPVTSSLTHFNIVLKHNLNLLKASKTKRYNDRRGPKRSREDCKEIATYNEVVSR